ncbi:MAG: serine/threonine-protein kinase [Planctomycetota bacterium]
MREPELSLDDELAIDALCDRFEADLAAGHRPVLARVVDAAPEHLRDRLDRELRLLLEEVDSSSAAGVEPSAVAELPERFGPYRIIGCVGRGGMGSVYEAVQDHPRRRVALKVVRPDLISARLRQRFGREIRLLAHLQHPGIARVLEAGAAPLVEGGPEVPYLAMEFVEGRPLREHVREEGLSVRERVQLVRELCLAIQHAHDQGVLHRDLKPANVIVTKALSSGEGTANERASTVGRPVVLDFGLARAIGDRGLGTLETLAGQVLGTLSYMAPEQLDLDPVELDGRCDVYALGAVLYELLAERLPLELEGLPFPAAIDRLRRDEAPPLGDLDRSLRGDLETIAAKALEKDCARRYPSALALGEDLQRYLDDVPIHARPASAAVQMRKFARRNPALVGGLGAAGVLLAIALVVVSIFAVRQRDLRADAERSAGESRLEAAKSRAIAEFQDRMFRRANLAEGGRIRDVGLVDVLTAGAAELDGAFDDQPLVEASLRHTIGRSLDSLREGERARPHLVRAVALFEEHLGPEHEDTLRARSSLGVHLEASGRLDDALREHEALVAIHKRSGTDDARLAVALSNAAAVLERLGRFDESIERHRESLAMSERLHGAGGAEVATCHNNLASALESSGDLRGALPHYKRALAIRLERLEPPHALLANALNNLGALHLRLLDLERAEVLLGEALAMREELLGPDHPIVATSLSNLSALHASRGESARAEELCLRALEISEPALGPEHRDVLAAWSNYAQLLAAQGRDEEALAVFDEMLERARSALGERDRTTLLLRTLRLTPLGRLGRIDEAQAGLASVLEDCRAALGADSLTAELLRKSANLAARQDDTATAKAHYREAIVMMEAVRGPADRWTLECRAEEIELLGATGRSDLAQERARAALQVARESLGSDDPLTRRLGSAAR